MIRPGQISAQRLSGELKDEREHFYVCPRCGQAVDKRETRTGDAPREAATEAAVAPTDDEPSWPPKDLVR